MSKQKEGFRMQVTRHGKEIEDVGNPLMDEIFGKFSLMYEHYIEQDEIEHYFIAFSDDGDVVGFMGVGYCGRTVLIEVLAQGRGIGSKLIKFAVQSGCVRAWQPRQNGCEEFWEKMADWASETPECDMREVA